MKKIRQKTKKLGRGKAKGSKFERDICKRLSLWWTANKNDDVFWRTAGSGARATCRGKVRTFGQYGDIQATDPIGQPLIDAVTIELKCGYSQATVNDFIDSSKKKTKPVLLNFMEQVDRDRQLRDDDSSWLLILKRDRKDAIIFTPFSFYKKLRESSGFKSKMKSTDSFLCIRCIVNKKKIAVFASSLDWFLSHITPQAFILVG